jgi:hypothetical protein
MGMRSLVVVIGCAIACRPAPARPPLAPAGFCPPLGATCDDGAGELARASAQIVLGDDQGTPGFGDTKRRSSNVYGGDPYGGALYGGDAYGGTDYASIPMPPRAYINVRRPRYAPTTGLTGSVEGVVSWSGAMPAKVCGGPRIGSDRGVGGVLVYVEHVTVGRNSPNGFGRPASVGGTLAKRGCALVPAAQLVTPLPATLMIHGDVQRASVKVQPPGGEPKAFDLQEAGLVDVDLEPGVTRVDSERAAAWVVAVDTPYYAITDDGGRFRLDELAPGTYEITFWEAPVPDGNGKYGAPIVVHRTVKVEAKVPARLSVSIGK